MDGGDDAREDKWAKALITEGEWAGWYYLHGDDPFEDHAGPFYFRDDEKGRVCAFRAEPRHMNGGNFMHGGCLMTFADFTLFDRHAVTATFNAEFVGAVPPGSLVEARAEIVKAGKSMVFMRGLITTGGEPVLSFSATLKKTGPRT
jgi:acyl-coenzyme A thioesterase PaaI-like protein